jgi:signal transduction histidine kinase
MRMARPQLVLLDMMMPEMSGEDVVQQMRAEESLRDIPVILLTARASEEDRLFGLSLGVDDYLAKPIVADELSFRVSNMLDRHELLRQVERLEGQDKLIQMGELFSDLSHELKNILHSGASVSDLQLHDARLALAGVSLGDAQREDLASALLKSEAPLDGLRRMESLDIPPQSPIKDALRSLRQILAFMNVSDQLLMRLWEDFQTMSEDELRYLENQLKILDQHQALMRMTRRTKELTHSVLAFSRTGSSDDSADISRIWLQVLQMAQARARRYTVRIDKDLDSHLVRANPSQLLQIILNLTMNALDAIGERAPEDRWIRISSQVREGFVDIILTNGGPQIPASVRARLFERGFSTKGEKGTGIGLHVSQRLAAKMGGTLRCEGEGAHPCFVVSLPLAATQEAKRDIAA